MTYRLRQGWNRSGGTEAAAPAATDMAPEFAQDARVPNRLSGHSDSSTRERVYQDPLNELVLARAAKVRRDMRKSHP